jgi:hypothetical protein
MVYCNATAEEQTSTVILLVALCTLADQTGSQRGTSVFQGHLPSCRTGCISRLCPHLSRRRLLPDIQARDSLLEAMGTETVITPPSRQSCYEQQR